MVIRTRLTAATHRVVAEHADLENELVTVLKLDSAAAAEIAQAARSAHTPEAVDEVLELANRLMDAYGVEALDAEPDYGYYFNRYYRGIIALYVNTGDTYIATLLYDTENEIFMVEGWGDFLEAWERDHPEETQMMEERDGSVHSAGADTSALDDFNTDQPYEYARNYSLDGWLGEEDSSTHSLVSDLGYALEKHTELADRLAAEGLTPKLLAHSPEFLQYLKAGFEDALGNASSTAALDEVEKATKEWADTYEGHVAHLVDEAVAEGKLSAEEGEDVLETLLDSDHVWDVYLGDEGWADAVGENGDRWNDLLDLLGINKDDLEPSRGNGDTVSNGAYLAGMMLAEEALVTLVTEFVDQIAENPGAAQFNDPNQTSLKLEGRSHQLRRR
jgi:hypothetical protein